MANLKRVISIVTVFSILLTGGTVLAAPQQDAPQQQVQLTQQPIISWESLLKTCVDWLKNKPKGEGNYHIKIALVYNDKNGEAGYAEGSLDIKELLIGKPPASNQAKYTYLSGKVTLYESKDRWGEGLNQQYPFDPKKTEDLEVEINTGTGVIKIGGSTITKPGYAYGVAFGFEQKSVKPKYYVIELDKIFVPIPH